MQVLKRNFGKCPLISANDLSFNNGPHTQLTTDLTRYKILQLAQIGFNFLYTALILLDKATRVVRQCRLMHLHFLPWDAAGLHRLTLVWFPFLKLSHIPSSSPSLPTISPRFPYSMPFMTLFNLMCITM